MLLHIDADGKHGEAVAIPQDIVVNVPGAGAHPLYYALEKGGPSLLVRKAAHPGDRVEPGLHGRPYPGKLPHPADELP
jgi:hypothetical protein